jgi:poly-gamma-glutamate synthesis protein (capsule biosynthesis protein)
VEALTRLNNYNFPGQQSNYAHLIRQRVRKDLPPKVAKLSKKVDFTVVVLHWGVEYKHSVIARERRLIRLLEKAGCDLFIGHHPHVLRGIQRYGDMVAFYSLGNFLFDNVHARRAEAGLARAIFEKRGDTHRLAKAEFIPLILNGPNRIPRPAKGSVAKRINRRMIRYSRAFRKTTKLRPHDDRLEVVLR